MDMRKLFFSTFIILISLINTAHLKAQDNILTDVQLEFVPYVNQQNPTDTLLDYYCVVTLSDSTSHPTLYVKAGSDSTSKNISDHFNNVFYVESGYVSGADSKNTKTENWNTKDGNKVRIYIGRYHFEFLYCTVDAKDRNGNSLGTKIKDMRKQ
jgi:hypothetical protein